MARVSFDTRKGRVSFQAGGGRRRRKSRNRLPDPEFVFTTGNALERRDYPGTRAGDIYKIGRKHYIATREGLLRPVKLL